MDTKSGIDNHNKFFCREPEFLFDGIPKKIQLKFIRWTKTVLLKKTPLYMLIVAWTSLLISCLPNVEKELKKLKQIYIGPQNVPLYYNKLAVEFKRKIILLEYVRIFKKMNFRINNFDKIAVEWVFKEIFLPLRQRFPKMENFSASKTYRYQKLSVCRVSKVLYPQSQSIFFEQPIFFSVHGRLLTILANLPKCQKHQRRLPGDLHNKKNCFFKYIDVEGLFSNKSAETFLSRVYYGFAKTQITFELEKVKTIGESFFPRFQFSKRHL